MYHLFQPSRRNPSRPVPRVNPLYFKLPMYVYIHIDKHVYTCEYIIYIYMYVSMYICMFYIYIINVHLLQPGRSDPPRTMARVGLGI